jgi:hypothetical protein
LNASSDSADPTNGKNSEAPVTVDVTIELSLDPEDAHELRGALGIGAHGELGPFLTAVAKTATGMYLDELVGRVDYPSKVAARQTRLLKLVEHAFGGVLPSPLIVANLFHISESSATALLSSTSARYRRALRSATVTAVQNALRGNDLLVRNQSKKEANPKYRFYCVDDQVLRSLRQALRRQKQAVATLTADPEVVGTYVMRKSTVDALSVAFDITVSEMTTPPPPPTDASSPGSTDV